MLQQMRKYTKSWLGFAIIGIPVVISFVVWGIADIFRGNTDTSIATVGDVKIPLEAYQQDVRNLTRQATQNGTLTSGDQRRFAKQALEGLLDRTAIDNYVRRYGLTVSDDTVSARIRAIPAFTGPLGTFDHNQFLRMIDQAGYTEQGFIDAIRTDLTRDQLLQATGSGLELPQGYARAFFNFLNEVRAADFVVIPASAAGAVPMPDDTTLQAYVKAHPDRYSTPEYRDVSFAWLSPNDVMGQIKVSDDQLKQQYEVQKSQYVVPEKRELEQITFPDIAAAKAAKAKIDSGTSFAEIAKQRGLKAADIQIGSLTKDDLAERGEAIFKLQQGGVTEPLKAPVGYALIHVVSIAPGSTKTFEDVKEELRKQIGSQLAQAKLGDISNQYIDESSRGESLAQAAKKVGMHVGHVAAIDSKGNLPDGSKAPIPPDPELLAQMFKAEIGEEGDPFQAKSGTTYVVNVQGVRPPKLKPLDAVRREATLAWQKEQLATRLEKIAKEMAAKASAQNSLKSVAASLGAKLEASGALRRPLVRNQQQAGPLPRDLREKIFKVPAGQAVYGPTADRSGYIIALVTAVNHPPPQIVGAAQLTRFGAPIGQQIGNDIAQSMARAARETEGVKINQQAVDRVAGESS